MLGSRTKQVNVYGKRSHRIIDASDRRTVESQSIFDDLPQAPKLAPLASKMKKRENAIPTKIKPMSPKVVGLQKKKRLSPVISPIRKKRVNRVAEMIEAERKLKSAPLPKPKSIPTGSEGDPIVHNTTTYREPLSTYPANMPGSPAASFKPRTKQRVVSSTSRKSNKPFVPFVDMDIMILDDDGQTIRQESRISKKSAEMNIVSYNNPPRISNLNPSVALSDDNDSESGSQHKLPRRLARRAVPIVYSDSDSDGKEEPPDAQGIIQNAKPPLKPRPNIAVIHKSRLVLEVVIPPAPYSLEHTSRPLSPSVRSQEIESIPVQKARSTTLQQTALRTQYQPIPSPVVRPRQLTPIRGGRKRLFEPISPPSPSTPTDFDLSFDLSHLDIGSPSQNISLYPETVIPEYLRPLLEECHQEQCGPHEFSAFIESFPYDPIVALTSQSEASDIRFRKIGEASYSEVFGLGDVVLKVIPLRDESVAFSSIRGTIDVPEEEDGPAPSDARDVRKEIIVTRAMCEVDDKFVRLLKTYVVRGRYPQVLLDLWDDFNERKGSESVRPDTFKVSQIYAIIVLPNGGSDLEAYTFAHASKSGWRQAASLFWQVTKSLAHAEQLVSFEHRDLHWGQILIKNLPVNSEAPLKSVNMNRAKAKAQRSFMEDLTHGVRATIIDLGLSRMDAGDGGDGERVHWTPFDEEVFMGEGDHQFDVYRYMRDHIVGAWDCFHPMTNVMWLHYLVQKLIHSKGLRPPASPRKTKSGTNTSCIVLNDNAAFTERDCYECLVDIEGWLAKCIADVVPFKGRTKGKGRQKLTKTMLGPACAGEIVEYGVKKNWIQST